MSVDEIESGDAMPSEQSTENAASRGKPRQMSMNESLVRPVLDRIESMEKEFSEKLDLLAENRRLSGEVRRLDQELARRDVEIEKFKSELVYQKRLLEKEIEDRRRALEERWALMDREVSDRVAREREEFERRLASERSIWSERLKQGEEKFASDLAELQKKEGFWSRLIRMLTWS